MHSRLTPITIMVYVKGCISRASEQEGHTAEVAEIGDRFRTKDGKNTKRKNTIWPPAYQPHRVFERHNVLKNLLCVSNSGL